MQTKEKKGYARKVALGLVPADYDKSSKRFQLGAWKNLNRQEMAVNCRALKPPHPAPCTDSH